MTDLPLSREDSIMKDPKKQSQAEKKRRGIREDTWIKLVLRGEDLTEFKEVQAYTDYVCERLIDNLNLFIIPSDFKIKPKVNVRCLVLGDRLLLLFSVSNALINLFERYVNASTGVVFRDRTLTCLQLEFNFVRRQKSRLTRGNYETQIVVDGSLEEAVKTSLSLLEREYDIDMQRFLDIVRNP